MLTIGVSMLRQRHRNVPAMIYAELVRSPGLRVSELARNLGVSYNTVVYWLCRLEKHENTEYGICEKNSRLYPTYHKIAVN